MSEIRSQRESVPESDYYLPATPSLSSAPGPVERVLTRLFRRRGGYQIVARTDE